MSNPHHSESVEISSEGNQGHGSPGFLSPDGTMVLFTWITFFLLLALLNKFAWKPILRGLDEREDTIRKSLDDADKIRVEMAQLQATHDRIMLESQTQGKEMIEQSRKAAGDAAKAITHKAKEEARIQLENARRDIKNEAENAKAMLRVESVHIAIDLAGKLIEENLDDDKNRKLVNRVLNEI